MNIIKRFNRLSFYISLLFSLCLFSISAYYIAIYYHMTKFMLLDDPIASQKDGINYSHSLYGSLFFLLFSLLLHLFCSNKRITFAVILFMSVPFYFVASIPAYCIDYSTEIISLKRPLSSNEINELRMRSLGRTMNPCLDVPEDESLKARIPRGEKGRKIKDYFSSIGILDENTQAKQHQ